MNETKNGRLKKKINMDNSWKPWRSHTGFVFKDKTKVSFFVCISC